ncbi:hypothetical protein VM57_12760 [Stenotrophomonas maltophilia]|uniref:Uncharacterized protein n=1 Tax=Stenotrophomonas maltophilia TaxID=40324 RepID=A0A0F5ZQ81_STEMA|nr:hypothetical protein VM57_12760 [Stenotrophomonas maltophilia]
MSKAVLKMLRKDVDEVMLVTHSGHFSKAYALNRFLLILLHRILRREAANGRPRLILRSGPATDSVSMAPPRVSEAVSCSSPPAPRRLI